jgi:hypothetical protein
VANVRLILLVAAIAAAPASAAAQSVSVGVEPAYDRFTYRFENPSSFDTPQPVPHFFEQSYVADNLWLVAAVRYTAAVPWETSGGATFRRTLPASDFDTFFNPDGAVIVSGTNGDAEIQSFRVSQRAQVGRARAVVFGVGYTLRYDRADFLVGHKVVTRNGEVIQAFDVTTREMTSSIVQEFFFGADAGRALGPRWRVAIGGEAAPATTGRLAIELPDKYPGATLVFVANGLTATGRLTFNHDANRHPITLTIEALRGWGYSSDNSLARERVSARVMLGM